MVVDIDIHTFNFIRHGTRIFEKALMKELNKAEGLIKQIGLDSELTKVQKAKTEVSSN